MTIPARISTRATGSGGHVPPGVVAAQDTLAGVKRPASLSTSPARHCVGGFSGATLSYPRRTRAIRPGGFRVPTRPNGVGFNRGTPVFAANGNTASGTPFVWTCLSYASVRSCHRAEATGAAA